MKKNNLMNIYTEDNQYLGDILIVDDKFENIRFLSNFLSEQNYLVRKAISGHSALIAAKTLTPDLILLDVNMPGMGGYEVCQHLKSDPQTNSIPVVFLSAGSDVNDKVRAFEAGGIDYITKPFQLEEVLVRVKTQLTLQKLRKELEQRNAQIENTLITLKNTQAELIQKEKLVNANRITAGIAHEINNPLSFIICNLEPVTEYSQSLINLVQLYQTAFPNPTPEIRDYLDQIELEFLVPDLNDIVSSISNGAERIRSVVRALYIFSGLDESGVKPINVSECIESVLLILSYRLISQDGSVSITVLKTYDNLPTFSGYSNLFNQSLINLLENSLDALELKVKSNNFTSDKSFTPTIWISTYISDDRKICISIKDNGIGVPEENRPHLFEPFFTTKSIGKGVGLGLFTSQQIINEIHGGDIVYQDNLEGYSEFIIQIPISD